MDLIVSILAAYFVLIVIDVGTSDYWSSWQLPELLLETLMSSVTAVLP